jgi:hypothetical protein
MTKKKPSPDAAPVEGFTESARAAGLRYVHDDREVLDPFHALEHAAAAAKGLYGEGAAEGLARRMGDRLKTPGRGWREDHLDPMATLVNLVQTPEWPDLWKPSAN